MSDLVEQSEYSLMDKLQLCNDIPICREAADRIEQLEAALDILQAAMTAKKPIPMAFKKAILEARAALEERT